MTGARTTMLVSYLVGLLLGCLMVASLPAVAAGAADRTLRWPAELNDVAAAVGQLCEQRKFEEARAIIERRQTTATDYEQRACLARFLGKTYERAKAFDQAIACYRQVIEQYPNSRLQVSWAKRDLAVTYMDKAHRAGPMEENMRLAVQVLEEFVQLYPDFERIDGAWMMLADCNEHLGNYETALTQHLKEVELYPSMRYSPECLMDAIALQQKLGRWDEAIASARRYMDLYPDQDVGGAQIQLAQSYKGKGDLERGALEMDKAMVQYPEAYARWRSHDYYDKARAANRMGDHLAAARSMAVVVHEPGWDQSLEFPLKLYALWCRSLGEHVSPAWFNEAIWANTQLLGLVHSRLQELIVRSEIAYYRQGLGQHEAAVTELRDILAAQPADAELVERCRKWLQVSEAALATSASSAQP